MNCPRCGLSVPSNNVVAALRAARCTACDTLFDTSSLARAAPRPGAPTALAAPERWQLEEIGGRFSARWKWLTASAFFLLPFTLIWNGMLATMGWSASERGAHPERLLLGLVVPHVWVGVGLAYWVLATFLNTTTVSLADGKLAVRHAPLWWPGGRLALERAEVRQLFVVEQRGKNGSTFQLCALLRDGRRQVVVRSLPQEADARFLEAKLERLLDLVDQPVAGEVSKG